MSGYVGLTITNDCDIHKTYNFTFESLDIHVFKIDIRLNKFAVKDNNRGKTFENK